MNLSVSLRIIVGYAIVLLLALAIFFAGIFGVGNINGRLLNISDRAIPMIDLVASLQSGVLQSYLHLVSYEKGSLESLSGIQDAYQTQDQLNEAHSQELDVLVKDNKALHKKLVDVNESMESINVNAQNMMVSRLSALQIHAKLKVQSEEFSSLGDEIIGYAYELDEVANDEQQQVIGVYVSHIEDLSNAMMDALSEGTIAAANGNIEDISRYLKLADGDISGMSSLSGNDAFDSLTKAYKTYHVYAGSKDNLLQLLLTSEQKLITAQKQLHNADEARALAVAKLNDLIRDVKELAGSIQAGAQDEVVKSRKLLILFTVIALISAGAIGFYIVYTIRDPLNTTVSAIGNVARGDFTQEFVAQRDDELGALSLSMQELVSQLRAMFEEISGNAQSLANTAEKTTHIAEQGSANTNQQREQTDMVATALEEMSATVEQVTGNINNTLAEVENADELVKEGTKVVRKNIDSVTHLAENINQATEVIQQLNEDCNNIGSILDVIRGVAEQTNLLALNAAIEAARAGEQGRGFAVVADEVRTLASRAHDSTAEIDTMIEKLQAGAQKAVSTMNASQEEAQDSAENIQSAGDALDRISGGIATIKEMSQQIATASQGQAEVTREQNRSVQSIAEVAESTAVGAEQSLEASRELVEMSDNLKNLISRFKI